MICFGDSITHGYGASVQAKAWVDLLIPVNVGTPAAQAADVSIAAHQFTPWHLSPYTVLVGTNDITRYRDNADKRAFYARCVRSIVAWLAMTDKAIPRLSQGQIISSGGTWQPTPAPNGIGLYTTDVYAYQSVRVNGTRVFVGLSEGDNPAMSTGVRILIDGVIVADVSVRTAGVGTHLGSWYGNACWSFGGLTPGPHDVTVQNMQAGGTVHVNYIAGNTQTATPKIILCTVPKYSDAAYAWSDTTPTMTTAFNAEVLALAPEFAGLKVVIADLHAAVIPNLHLTPDGVHPNDAGHQAIALAVRQALAA